MAEFVEVIKAKHRMCMSFSRCADCLLGDYDCATPTGDEIAKVEKTILAWAVEHPEPKKKTMREVLYEKFPDAQLSTLCASLVFGEKVNCIGVYGDCNKCWGLPAPDEYQSINE